MFHGSALDSCPLTCDDDVSQSPSQKPALCRNHDMTLSVVHIVIFRDRGRWRSKRDLG